MPKLTINQDKCNELKALHEKHPNMGINEMYRLTGIGNQTIVQIRDNNFEFEKYKKNRKFKQRQSWRNENTTIT